ncbi:phage tail protein [Malaciobacter marinus]|uniref:phage tail protein n=1 Tax=Malaciobacter marinus TaxID=505249 RepID=UPI003B0048F1
MKVVVVQENKRLDEIVFSHYGNLDHFDDVVEVNEKLSLKTILELGDEVYLPEFQKKQKEQIVQALWS